MLENSEREINYNDDDVWYCSSCLSLKIVNLGEDELVPCYCASCGSTDVTTSHVDDWDRMYKKRYGKNYINKR